MSLSDNTKNYFISYDLNGPIPTHAQMDAHIKKLAVHYGRVLETVWYVSTTATLKQVYEYVNSILSANDRVLEIDANDAYFRNLLVSANSLQQAWAEAA